MSLPKNNRVPEPRERIDARHMNQRVVLVGVGRDREYTNQGISHYADGDERVMGALPLKILKPASEQEVKTKVVEAYQHMGSSYLNLSRYG